MTDRKPHLLKPTTGLDRPTSVIFFDTETTKTPGAGKKVKHHLRLGCASHCRTIDGEYLRHQRSILYKDQATFWSFVNERARGKTVLYLVAHNIVFDLTVLNAFVCLTSLGWTMDNFYTKGTTSLFRWSNGDRKIIAMDNTNLFPGPLADWGKDIGRPKGYVDFDNVDDEALAEYCQNDVDIMRDLWRLWLTFLDDNNCGAFKTTTGATALNAWRHGYLSANVFIHDDELALQLEREAYKGARVECLWQGKSEAGPFYYVDVNSMYGYVMANRDYPNALVGSSNAVSMSMLVRKLDKYAVIARVVVDVDDNYYPFTVNGHKCYPLGSFETTLSTPELLLAVKRGWLRSVKLMSWYTKAPLFRDYVKYFAKLRGRYRRSNNRGMESICKLLINSLYGKFGQTGFSQTVLGSVDDDQLWTMPVYHVEAQTYSRHIAVAGQLYDETKTGESYNSFPAIAAHVTAYARLVLYDLVRDVPARHVFYMDTDSLIVDQTGLNALTPKMDPHRLGYLKIETSSPWLEVNAPKDYAMENRRRLKGISKEAVEIEPGVFKQYQWMRLVGMIQSGDMDGYTAKEVIKHPARLIHSGFVGAEGWIDPYRLALAEVEVQPEAPLKLSR
jgi:hypothetical protein